MDDESCRYDKLERMLQDGRSEPRNLRLPLEFLKKITNNFCDSNDWRLGEGGFGTVYKGVLQNGEIIAVKKLYSSIPGVKDRQFENEANHLMRLKHPNVVRLVGWCYETEDVYVEYGGKYICAEKSERLLCLEYMPNGSLRGYLSDEISGLGWGPRYKIIKGICNGLLHLHVEYGAPIIHMDLKPANILLDKNMVPKIADFGLSRLFSEEKTWTCTTSRDGTLGYMAPEYINRGRISTKSDIFSLGVIIIEIVTGHRDYPDDTVASSYDFILKVLNNWSKRNCPETSVVDCPQIKKCLEIGLACVHFDWSQRPEIIDIIMMLDKQETNFPTRFFQGRFNAAHYTTSTEQESQSRKRCLEGLSFGETDLMEKPAKQMRGFLTATAFIVRHQRTRRIRVLITAVVFSIRLQADERRRALRRRQLLKGQFLLEDDFSLKYLSHQGEHH
ncbi:putative receptor-like protein kinase At4g00960 isoform X2 [Panicum virgatum]|uniref:Protein kinase domain-containing protein n=1 Tax=Panicum virgatum TaxID=38727 RepID=A0A8T0TBT2_PANVG|nr:putative receptor-like protein kinase At4g00960 isoform X2 [Panicum virgatum]XP_039807378.1 putative receptor-like protein kinase At4g00960 isoform X2 [Panicum virgatum]KAG2606703.1 hypothetical protein PVAP13_4NG211952 [Panicum virgatum]